MWQMESPQNRRFYGKTECLSLWRTFIGQKGRTLDKKYGITAGCYWEHPWGTLLGTWWKLIRNIKGICWEQRKNEKMELHTNIRHYFPLILWCLGVCSGWVGHMETGPYACPLKTSLLQWPRTCTFTKWRLWAQCKARVELGLLCFFFSILCCSDSGKPPQTNFNLIGNIFV
jgi:hypothetical protein